MARYKQGANSLLGLLLRHQRCLSTNPRDKVYAFCPLMGTSPSEFIDVRVRYEDAVEAVYRDVAIKILQHDRNLDILSHSPLPPTISSSTSDLLGYRTGAAAPARTWLTSGGFGPSPLPAETCTPTILRDHHSRQPKAQHIRPCPHHRPTPWQSQVTPSTASPPPGPSSTVSKSPPPSQPSVTSC